MIDRLSQELLNILLDQVGVYDDFASRADLKNLRLVKKALAATAAPRLFE